VAKPKTFVRDPYYRKTSDVFETSDVWKNCRG